jgi:hypothetical protein
MPGFGRAYSTSASVTSRPIAADFAFHLSEAINRQELPHCGFALGGEVIKTWTTDFTDEVNFFSELLLA